MISHMPLPLASRSPALPLLALALLTGCGDDGDEGRRYEASCDSACVRAAECSSSVDMETCTTDCIADAMDIGPHLSGVFLAALDECIAESNCVELAVMPIFQGCQRDATASVAPSPAAEDLCDAIVASFQMCLGVTVGTSGCLQTVKIFSDSALISAQSCDEMPCDKRVDCLREELGVDPSGMQ